jgi:hypothetical protein
MPLHQLEDMLGVEAPHQDLFGPQHCGRLGPPPAVGVVERDGVEVDHGGGLAVLQCVVQRVEVERAVGEHHALRRAGGATGVEDLGNGEFVVGGEIGVFFVALGQQGFVAVLDADPVLDSGARGAEPLGHRCKFVFIEKDSGSGVAKDGG